MSNSILTCRGHSKKIRLVTPNMSLQMLCLFLELTVYQPDFSINLVVERVVINPVHATVCRIILAELKINTKRLGVQALNLLQRYDQNKRLFICFI